MTQQLSKNAREALAKALGDAFTFKDFDDLTHECWGDRVINNFTFSDQPRFRIACDVIDKVEDEGFLDKFLFICIKHRNALLDIIQKWHSNALIPSPALATQIQNINVALRDFITDNEVRDGIAASSQFLDGVVAKVGRLTTYKRIHDAVHQILLRSLHALYDDARKMTTDEIAVEHLQDYLNTVRTSIASANQAKDRLVDPIAIETEINWIRELTAEADIFGNALSHLDSTDIRMTAIKVTGIAESEARRLNTDIVVAAKTLPLEQLSKILSGLHLSSDTMSERLMTTARDVSSLRGFLLTRTNIHNRLQGIQKDLAALTLRLVQQGPDILRDFAKYWPRVRRTITDVLSLQADPGYPQPPATLVANAENVEACLLGVEETESGGHDAAQLADRTKTLDIAFKRFRNSVSLHFFEVDKSLLNDLERLSEISQALQPILNRPLP